MQAVLPDLCRCLLVSSTKLTPAAALPVSACRHGHTMYAFRAAHCCDQKTDTADMDAPLLGNTCPGTELSHDYLYHEKAGGLTVLIVDNDLLLVLMINSL